MGQWTLIKRLFASGGNLRTSSTGRNILQLHWANRSGHIFTVWTNISSRFLQTPPEIPLGFISTKKHWTRNNTQGQISMEKLLLALSGHISELLIQRARSRLYLNPSWSLCPTPPFCRDKASLFFQGSRVSGHLTPKLWLSGAIWMIDDHYSLIPNRKQAPYPCATAVKPRDWALVSQALGLFIRIENQVGTNEVGTAPERRFSCKKCRTFRTIWAEMSYLYYDSSSLVLDCIKIRSMS